MIDQAHTELLLDVLAQARQLGFVGPGDLAPHVDHSLGFLAAVPHPPATALDLGSGGGLPGLVLVLAWPTTTWVLVDASARRTAFLAEAVEQLGVGDRVEVLRGRAETLAQEARWRASQELVVARSFGPPAVVAECAAGFLAVGGRLVVSEPPDPAPADRWPATGLALLGQRPAAAVTRPDHAGHFQVVEQVEPCPPQFPRRDGVPAKRPLF